MTEASEPLLTASDIVGELEHSVHDQHFLDSAAVMVFFNPILFATCTSTFQQIVYKHIQ
jgi:hypothetical protein